MEVDSVCLVKVQRIGVNSFLRDGWNHSLLGFVTFLAGNVTIFPHINLSWSRESLRSAYGFQVTGVVLRHCYSTYSEDSALQYAGTSVFTGCYYERTICYWVLALVAQEFTTLLPLLPFWTLLRSPGFILRGRVRAPSPTRRRIVSTDCPR